MRDFSKIEQRLGYTFEDKHYLRMALTHRTFAKERAIKYDNQRLEFLGDAVLQLILSEALYFRHSDQTEGYLTKVRAVMVRESSLAQMARALKLQDAVILGRGEERAGGNMRDSLLGDLFEAVLGAIYLDGGIHQARRFILNCTENLFPDLAVDDDDNPKGTLQELVIHQGFGVVQYEELGATGPDHARLYRIRATVGVKFMAEAEASRIKKAEAIAARALLEQIRSEHPHLKK